MNENLAEAINRIKRLEDQIQNLQRLVLRSHIATKKGYKKRTTTTGAIDFSLNERAFVKRYAEKKSGPRKFTILLGYLAAGEVGKDIPLTTIQGRWNKMKSLLGKFNRFYANQAKNQGRVDSKKRGTYRLTKEWTNAL